MEFDAFGAVLGLDWFCWVWDNVGACGFVLASGLLGFGLGWSLLGLGYIDVCNFF